MARRCLRPREAHHLRGRGGTHQLCQAELPQPEDPLNQTRSRGYIFLSHSASLFKKMKRTVFKSYNEEMTTVRDVGLL